MAKEGSPNYQGDEKGETVVSVPIETVVNSDGTTYTDYAILSRTEEAADAVAEEIARRSGGSVEKIPETGKKSFGFNSKKWNSPWNPTGPTPNWSVKNTDPKDN